MEIAIMTRGKPVYVSYNCNISVSGGDVKSVLSFLKMFPEESLQEIITTIEREQEEAKKASQDAAASDMAGGV